MTKEHTIDTLIQASWVLPIVPQSKLYKDCALAINDGEIIDICPNSEAEKRYCAASTIALKEHVLMPGLINAHTHASMSLLRGYADDQPLAEWLEKHIWPAEKKWVDHEFVALGAELAIAEMLQTGTTCFSDMYFYPEASCQAVLDAGIRAQVLFPVLEFATQYANSAEDYIDKGLQLHDKFSAQDKITIGFGPHAPYTVGDHSLSRIVTLAEELQAPVQIHLHETANEVGEFLLNKGVRPLAHLASLGLLSPLLQCVHMTQADDSDVDLLATSGAHVIHCPTSNLKLASGLCPVQKLLDANINVCVGTDGAASNNSLDLFRELNLAALLGKLASGDASAINATQALEMATIQGAKALGLEDKIGSIEKGKRADLIAVDLSNLSQQPMHQVISQLVYTHCGQQVTHVWVDGKQLVDNKMLLSIDSEALKSRVHQWQDTLSA